MQKEILGYIDCPSCGTVKGMRITEDKNGHPYGYCEAECSQQLRIGGDASRVEKFRTRYPWARGKAPVSHTVPENKTNTPSEEAARAPVNVSAPATETPPPPPRKKAAHEYLY